MITIGLGHDQKLHSVGRTEGADEAEYRSVCGNPVKSVLDTGEEGDLTCTRCLSKIKEAREDRLERERLFSPFEVFGL